jgi:hypothetical protein
MGVQWSKPLAKSCVLLGWYFLLIFEKEDLVFQERIPDFSELGVWHRLT